MPPFQGRFLPFLDPGGKKYVFHSPFSELFKIETFQGPVSVFHCRDWQCSVPCVVLQGCSALTGHRKTSLPGLNKPGKLALCDGLNVTIDSSWLQPGLPETFRPSPPFPSRAALGGFAAGSDCNIP